MDPNLNIVVVSVLFFILTTSFTATADSYVRPLPRRTLQFPWNPKSSHPQQVNLLFLFLSHIFWVVIFYRKKKKRIFCTQLLIPVPDGYSLFCYGLIWILFNCAFGQWFFRILLGCLCNSISELRWIEAFDLLIVIYRHSDWFRVLTITE